VEGPARAKGRGRGAPAGKSVLHKWGKLYPSAISCVSEDVEPLVAHLRFPKEPWTRIRHSNLIECTFSETRRRVKVIGRLPDEQTCLSLVWAVLDRASKGWRGLTMTPAGLRRLQDLPPRAPARSRT
jgi:putative transposase